MMNTVSQQPRIIGNWKMVGTASLCEQMATALASVAVEASRVVLAPPAHLLSILASALAQQGLRELPIAAQNCFAGSVKEGAYTGEISAVQLAEIGVKYVIIGHSERRTHYGETDAMFHAKVSAAVEAGLIPILCVGETEQERAEGNALAVIAKQLQVALKDISAASIMIAYEPVWAIGSGKVPTIAEIHEVLSFIHSQCAFPVSCLYGGSVKADNSASLWQGISAVSEGFLVGSASTTPTSLLALLG
jgi:triosephosphate isomerase